MAEGSFTSNDLLKRLDLLSDIPQGVTAIADEAIFRDAASTIRELERRLEAANARIQRWEISGDEASPQLAVAPLELADGLLAQIGFQPDCSIRHNLAIALGHVRGHETSARLPTAFGSMHRNLQSLCDRLNEVFDVTEEGDVPDELCREAREAIEELWQERDQSLTFQAKAEIWRDGYRKGLAEASPSQPTPCWCPYCREPHGVNRQTEDPWKRAQEKGSSK